MLQWHKIVLANHMTKQKFCKEICLIESKNAFIWIMIFTPTATNYEYAVQKNFRSKIKKLSVLYKHKS